MLVIQLNHLDRLEVQRNTPFNSQHGELVVKLIQNNIDLQIQNKNEQISQQKKIIDFYKRKLDMIDNSQIDHNQQDVSHQEVEICVLYSSHFMLFISCDMLIFSFCMIFWIFFMF